VLGVVFNRMFRHFECLFGCAGGERELKLNITVSDRVGCGTTALGHNSAKSGQVLTIQLTKVLGGFCRPYRWSFFSAVSALTAVLT
jgi:hypothetical protein